VFSTGNGHVGVPRGVSEASSVTDARRCLARAEMPIRPRL
jgi:hypothetical protein